jgi:hypothetical protein
VSEAIWIAIIAAIPTTIASLWLAVKGFTLALRWWVEKQEERITRELLGKQAIATVEAKNTELSLLREQYSALEVIKASQADEITSLRIRLQVFLDQAGERAT